MLGVKPAAELRSQITGVLRTGVEREQAVQVGKTAARRSRLRCAPVSRSRRDGAWVASRIVGIVLGELAKDVLVVRSGDCAELGYINVADCRSSGARRDCAETARAAGLSSCAANESGDVLTGFDRVQIYWHDLLLR